MADDNQDFSRLNNRNRRRKPRKWLTAVLAIAGVALVVVLLVAVLNDKPTMENQTADEQNQKSIAEQLQGNNDSSNGEDTEQADEEKQDDDEKEKEKEDKKEAEPSDDNVKEAYSKDWEPVGTDQSGTHTTTFEKGTQDWNEMMQAVGGAVGLDPTSMTAWWVENNGNGGNDVIATVSAPDADETFRVFASWVDGSGWQATKVEVLKENDRKS
ncbi:YrrS family protein [Terribacillus saccharophilus]|uniref:YrrS family protein n=1 Tax=Terribacillus saccharophilus TaxID=361277 RepID=UPI002DCF8205|nr:YrrS family protein [Terribacillus saccharophilus]